MALNGRSNVLRALLGVAALALLGGCNVPDPKGTSPLRYRDAIFPNVSVTQGLQYGQSELPNGTQQKLLLDVYQPAGDTATKRPVMLWVHGGGFTQGSRTDSDVRELANRFTRRGYVSISIDYRLDAGSLCGGAGSATRCLPAALDAADDERAAIRWLRVHAADLKIDTERIGIGGTSAGAIASIVAGATADTPGDSGNPGPSSAVRAVVSISGGLPTNLLFNDGDPPMLFWHGTSDTVVPYDWAVSNTDNMTDKGLIGILHEVSGAGHVPLQYIDDMDTQARNFMYAAMRLKSAAQN